MLALFNRPVSPVWPILLLSSLLCGCGGGGGGGGGSHSGTTSPTTACPFGDLAKETAYATSEGGGSIKVLYSTSLPDVGLSQIINGQRVVTFNPNVLATMPPEVQEFFYYHEMGHHYADHFSRYGLKSCKVAEYEADAFGSRVAFSVLGPAAVVSISDYFLFSGNAGDPTHRSGSERSTYITSVLNGLQSNPPVCPDIPSPNCKNQPLGALRVTNSFAPEVVGVFVDGAFVGYVGILSSNEWYIPAKQTHNVQIWGTIFNPLFGYTLYYTAGHYFSNGETIAL